jgi:hypothetical protein
MVSRRKHVGVALVVLSAAILFVLPGRQDAQNAVVVSANPAVLANGLAEQTVFGLLDITLELRNFQAPMSLKETLSLLIEDVKRSHGTDLPILVDSAAFKPANDPERDVYETKVQYPPFPRTMTVREALEFALRQIESRRACFVVKGDVIHITTLDAVSVEKKLDERVVAIYTNRRLADAFADIAKKSGVSIVLDQRAAAQTEKPISVTFRGDMNLAGALRALAESVDLKVVLLNGGLFVTTPAHAEVLRNESQKRGEADDSLWPRGLPGSPKQLVGQPATK